MAKKKQTSKSNIGFTLIELLVVIAIIGLLSTFVVVAMSNARIKARNAKRVADISQLQKALAIYYNDNQSYPTPGSKDKEQDIIALESSLKPTYLQSLPDDPFPEGTNYQYIWGSGGEEYGLLVPFANDGGTNCVVKVGEGKKNWFKKAPACDFN